MKQPIRSFEDLECWKAAREVRLFCFKLIKLFPKEEKYEMADNMKRAARSVTRNIAEGYGRFHYQENIQFCRQARGSLSELTDDLICCLDEKIIHIEQYEEGRRLIDKALALLNGYINYLVKAKEQTVQQITINK